MNRRNDNDTRIEPVERPIVCNLHGGPNDRWMCDSRSGELEKAGFRHPNCHRVIARLDRRHCFHPGAAVKQSDCRQSRRDSSRNGSDPDLFLVRPGGKND